LDGDIVEILEFSILDKASYVRPWQRGGLSGLQQPEVTFPPLAQPNLVLD